MNSYSGSKKIQEIEIASYLKNHCNLKEKVRKIRSDLQRRYPFIHRLSIALYHPERDIIQTYVYDEEGQTNLSNYEAVLSQCKSLHKLAISQKERIVNDLSIFSKGKHHHTKLIEEAGYLSSVTIPLLAEDKLLGFLFINSRIKNVFYEELTGELRLISMIFTLLLQQNAEKLHVLKSTIESMKMVSFGRDPETAEHQQRMASFSLLIAREIADTYHLTDPIINYIYLYAPLHDIGKIMIADNILLKEGPFSDDELLLMRQHSEKGDELIGKLIEIYQLVESPYISMLRAIIRWHHEKMDGSGYPDGLVGEQIPIAVRIVSVADIFDALTSVRPYKDAWTNEAAFKELQRLSGRQLDSGCVNALLNNKDQIVKIQEKFKDKYED